MTVRNLYRKADRNQAMADYLMQQGMTPIQMPQGAVTPEYGIGHGLTDLAQAYMASRAGKKADKSYGQADEARQKAMAEALMGMSSDPFVGGQSAIDAGADPSLVGMKLQSMQPQGPKPTDDIREYEFAKQQGFQGSFQDWQASSRAPLVNVRGSDPAPPQGYRNVYDDQGRLTSQQPIPGGPAAAKIDEQQRKEQGRQESLERKGDIVLDELRRGFEVLESPSLPETGTAGALLAGVPGTDAHALQQRLATVKANIGFDRLQEMRENSPTGGALGNVTIGELQRLEAVMGSLIQSEKKEDLQYNMARLNNIYLDTIHGEGKGPERMPLSAPPEQKENEFGLTPGKVEDGYRYIGGDPSKQESWQKI